MGGGRKAPSSKNQAPKKLQAPNFNFPAAFSLVRIGVGGSLKLDV
jgi:hypothetical protein